MKTSDLAMLVEHDYPDEIKERLFLTQQSQKLHNSQLTDKINTYSQQNNNILTKVSQIDAIKSEFLKQMI